jgi:hypothetical protein
LLEIFAHELGWPILFPPHKGLSFRLLVPLSEERRNNPVYGEKQTVIVQVKLDDGQTLYRYRFVDTPDWQSTAAGIILPPCSAAVIIE